MIALPHLDTTRPAAASTETHVAPSKPVRPAAQDPNSTTAAITIATIGLDLIEPHPDNPRLDWPEGELESLAASMCNHGPIQPGVLRPLPGVAGRFQLVAGERRWRAAKLAGLAAIPATVRDMSDGEALEVLLAENIERKDLNPIEVAQVLERICSPVEEGGTGLTREQAAMRFGHQEGWARSMVRLLKLPDAWQRRVRAGELEKSHALALTPYCDQPNVLARVEADMIANSWAWRSFKDFDRNLKLIAEGESQSAGRIGRQPRNAPAMIAHNGAKGPEDKATRDCQHCGMDMGPVRGRSHRCGVLILQEAIGLTFTAQEERIVRWLAVRDQEAVEVFAGLFRRVRGVEASGELTSKGDS